MYSHDRLWQHADTTLSITTTLVTLTYNMGNNVP